MNICNFCNNAFNKSSALSEHKLKVHQIKPSFVCPICKHISPSWKSCLKHIKICKTKNKQEEDITDNDIAMNEDDYETTNNIFEYCSNENNEKIDGNLIFLQIF